MDVGGGFGMIGLHTIIDIITGHYIHTETGSHTVTIHLNTRISTRTSTHIKIKINISIHIHIDIHMTLLRISTIE